MDVPRTKSDVQFGLILINESSSFLCFSSSLQSIVFIEITNRGRQRGRGHLSRRAERRVEKIARGSARVACNHTSPPQFSAYFTRSKYQMTMFAGATVDMGNTLAFIRSNMPFSISVLHLSPVRISQSAICTTHHSGRRRHSRWAWWTAGR